MNIVKIMVEIKLAKKVKKINKLASLENRLV